MIKSGWIFTLKQGKKKTQLLIFAKNLRGAVRELKKQNPEYIVTWIERFGDV